MNLQHNLFKVPEWYDPDKNMTRVLDWSQYDVFEAWDLITGEVIPCVVGFVGISLRAVETRWGKRVCFNYTGSDSDNHLVIDPNSKYKYFPISRYARIGRTVQKFDKVEYEYNLFTWVVYDIFDDRVKATNGIEYRIFDKDKITIIESLTPPKTIKEQIKCILNKIARTKIIKVITGLFVG